MAFIATNQLEMNNTLDVEKLDTLEVEKLDVDKFDVEKLDVDKLELETNTDSTRKLASLQRVDAVNTHENADSLVLVTILGWQIVVRKDVVKVGDVVVYCEIDSLLPGDAVWLPEAIKDRIKLQSNKSYFRVKTIKLRNEISQGLIIPITASLQELLKYKFVGDDVADLLNIQKYETPALSGEFAHPYLNHHFHSDSTKKSNFPSHLVSKTDEPRIQSNVVFLKQMKDKPYYTTVKLDGTSATYVIDTKDSTNHENPNPFLVCSRNLIREVPEKMETCPYFYIAEKYEIEKKLRKLHAQDRFLAIQGEICGPNIQSNLLGLKELDFFVFTITDTRTHARLNVDELKNVCLVLGLKMAPIEKHSHSHSFDFVNVKDILETARGYYNNTKNHREGLVYRSEDQRISFKVINNDYLLK
jgi:RNA ligase (TIGR02306 family)